MSQVLVTQQLYAQEFHEQWERKQSFLRGTVHTRGVTNADRFTFIIPRESSPAAERGQNGQIPIASYGQDALTVTLKEYSKIIEMTNFNIFSSSVPQRMNMQEQCITAINQKTDDIIVEQLQTASVNLGSATTLTLNWILEAINKLDQEDVPDDGRRWCALSTKAWAWLMKVQQATSMDYVDDRPFMKAYQVKNWMGVKFFKFTGLPSHGGAAAECYMWHEHAIGHALNGGDIKTAIGIDDKQDTSWCRASSWQGAVKLLNVGIVQMLHNDTTALS
jgi:hypothetical protein